MKKLNGWMRLWVVLSVLLLVFMMLFLVIVGPWSEYPSNKNVVERIVRELKEKHNVEVEYYTMMTNDQYETMLKNLLKKISDDNINISIANIDQLKRDWYKEVAFMVSVCMGLVCIASVAMYSIGRSIGWILSGFRENTTDMNAR